jgi:hypothetical protein
MSHIPCLDTVLSDLERITGHIDKELFFYSGSDGEFLRVRNLGPDLFELFSWGIVDRRSYGDDLDAELVKLRVTTFLKAKMQATGIVPGSGITSPRQQMTMPEDEYEGVFQLMKGRMERGEPFMQCGDSFDVGQLTFAMNKLQKLKT